MTDEGLEIGPVSYLIVEWPTGSEPTGEAFPLLVDLVDLVESSVHQPSKQGLGVERAAQGQAGQPFREVSVSGQVKAPGTYPLEEGMRVSDLLRAGGSRREPAHQCGTHQERP